MFPEHDFTIWGWHCPNCGSECSILQNEHHPWDSRTSFKVKMRCPSCACPVIIDQKIARAFYEDKIIDYFNGLHGSVIDLGCGGGFLSRNIVDQPQIERIYGIDLDPECRQETQDISVNSRCFSFIQSDIAQLGQLFSEKSVDYLVSRDAMMFVEDPYQLIKDTGKIIRKGVLLMGWYRMKFLEAPSRFAIMAQ
ncbi:MAG: class I SAM-dependent methyltransferase [Sporolactobacillus sp.]